MCIRDRDKTKSFFNLFWRGIEQGLKKELIGVNAPKTEKTIRKTVESTKQNIEQKKKELKDTKIEINQKIQNVREKGFLKNIFKKKSEK